MKEFTLETANEASRNNSMRNWVVDFLNADGNNNKLAQHIKENENLWIELLEFPLNKLKREMGPKEEGLVFSEDKEVWNKRIQSFTKDIKNGYIPCPLIATDFWSDVHLADGSHRHEALIQAGFSKYWTIFLIKKEENQKWILDNS